MTGPPSHTEATAEAARRERRTTAVRLLVDQELTYEQIGKQLGVSAKTICLDLQLAFEEMKEYRVAKMEERRETEERRTLRNDRAILPLLYGQIPAKKRVVTTGRGKNRVSTVVVEPPDPALVVAGQMRAHQRLSDSVKIRADLFGLNAPLKIAPTNPDGSSLRYDDVDDEEMARIVVAREARVAALGLPAVIDVTPSKNGHGSNGNGNG